MAQDRRQKSDSRLQQQSFAVVCAGLDFDFGGAESVFV